MPFFKNLTEKNREELINIVVKKTLDNILNTIESEKGDFDLDKIYEFIGAELAKIDYSALITIYDNIKKTIKVKSYYACQADKRVLGVLLETGIQNKHIPVETTANYKEAFKEKKAVFTDKRIYQLIKRHDYLKEKLKDYKEIKSIIAPLILRNEVIGGIEFFSRFIYKKQEEIFGNFADSLTKIFANTILFHEIKSSEARYRNLFENAKEGFIIYDSQAKKFVEANSGMREISGYTNDELKQISYLNIFSQEEKNRIADFITNKTSYYREDREKKSEENFETKIITKQKEKKYINLTINPTIKANEWFLVINDITKSKKTGKALQESKKRYKELWDKAPVGYHIVDLEGNIIKINKTEANMLGYKSSEMIGKSIFNFIVPEERELSRENLRKINNKMILPQRYERIFIKKNKERLFASVQSVLEIDDDGQPVSIWATVEDITDSKKAEKQLIESEEKYRKLVTEAREAVIIINKKGYITFGNASFFKMTGFVIGDLPHLHFSKFIHAEDYNKTAEKFSSLMLKKNPPVMFDFRVINKNGELKYFSCSGTQLVDDKKIIGMQLVIRDITENKLLQEKVEWAKNHYEKVIDTITDSICTINRNLEIISSNITFADKVGMPVDKVKGENFKDLIQNFEKKLLKNFNCCLLHENLLVKKCFNEGQYIEKECCCLDKNKQEHFYQLSAFPSADNNGNIFQVVITIKEITEEKNREEKIRQLSNFNQRILDTSPISILVLDNSGFIIAANQMAKRLMDKPEQPVVGTKLLAQPEIKENPEIMNLYSSLFKNGESFYYSNLGYRREGEENISYFNIIAVPLFDQNKKIEGAISMALDNTEAVIAKQKLEELNRDLEKKVIARTRELDIINKKLFNAIELKSKFIADSSHELRTPLTVIQGNIDLAIKEAENEGVEIPEIYSTIRAEVARMSGVLTDLTMLTNVDAENEQLNCEKLDLRYLIKSACQSLKILADEKRIALIYKKGIKKTIIYGDEAKLEKLLLNIIRNAIKYTEPKGRIKIWSENDKQQARIFVADNGIGIPEKDLPYIFERFYRVSRSRSRDQGGTGLGLSIAKWIIEAHGGRIDVESVFGKGSKFIINLPLDFREYNAIKLL